MSLQASTPTGIDWAHVPFFSQPPNEESYFHPVIPEGAVVLDVGAGRRWLDLGVGRSMVCTDIDETALQEGGETRHPTFRRCAVIAHKRV